MIDELLAVLLIVEKFMCGTFFLKKNNLMLANSNVDEDNKSATETGPGASICITEFDVRVYRQVKFTWLLNEEPGPRRRERGQASSAAAEHHREQRQGGQEPSRGRHIRPRRRAPSPPPPLLVTAARVPATRNRHLARSPRRSRPRVHRQRRGEQRSAHALPSTRAPLLT
jgi:hypothetical protein